ncbi:hypothetical protein C3E99_09880 [Sphingopyxis sp. MG]|nr:hypothetical protein C3E99_09880 [Sphingopyxis sp. MG]
MTSQARTSGSGKLLGVGVLGALVWFTRRGQKQTAKDDGHSAASRVLVHQSPSPIHAARLG